MLLSWFRWDSYIFACFFWRDRILKPPTQVIKWEPINCAFFNRWALFFVVTYLKARGVITCFSLFTEHSLWYFVHIRNLLFICGNSWFIFGIRYSCELFEVFFRITHFCAVTNNESNAITCSVPNRKMHSKRMKLLRYNQLSLVGIVQ